MLIHVVLLTEVLASIICIHCIYDKKVKLDVKTVSAILGILIILGISNFFQLSGIISFLGYVILLMYCKSKFKCSFVEAIIALVLCMIIVTSTQFISFSFFKLVIAEEVVRAVVGNFLILIAFTVFLPKCGIHRLYKGICKRSSFVILIVSFMCLVILAMLLQGKTSFEIQIQYFILVIPAFVLLLYSIMKWYTAHTEVERIQDEFNKTSITTEKYEDLLTMVRLRQHEFKNHLAAIISAHYTYKTYEKLVQAQEEYCKKLLDENRYNDLLLLGDNILVGYLYGKFQEAENDGIEINYKVATKIAKVKVPMYYVIEMLGILFDNAVEALKNSSEKVIIFEICEIENEYEFSIKNSYSYVPYDDIIEWFQLEKSEKGSGRGLGLYHLKCLCEEWNCDIGCKNVEINQKNWIVFTLKIGKADNN